MKVTIGPGHDFGDLTDDYSIAMRLHAQAQDVTWDPESAGYYINDADAAQAARQARDALEAYAVRVATLPPTPTEERGMLACVGHNCALLARLWDETLTDEGHGTAEDAPVDTAPAPVAEDRSHTDQVVALKKRLRDEPGLAGQVLARLVEIYPETGGGPCCGMARTTERAAVAEQPAASGEEWRDGPPPGDGSMPWIWLRCSLCSQPRPVSWNGKAVKFTGHKLTFNWESSWRWLPLVPPKPPKQEAQSSGCDGTAICQGCATCPL